MTEIPEHLLKRSKERRAAMGLGGGETPDAAGAEAGASAAGASASAGDEAAGVETPAAAPVAARAAAPAPAAPPPPPPDPPYVAAAKNRRKVPMWAAPVLAILPLWGFIYYQSLQPPPAGANDPLALGATIYAGKGGCAGCHAPDGSGGVGAKLNGGEVLKTFKNPLAMVHWIGFGAAGGARPNGTYGDLDRPGGPHNIATLPSAMPAQQDKLTPEEIAAVTIYVRQKISGGKPDKGFDVADFPTLGDVVTKVLALGPGGDPKVPGGSSEKATTSLAGSGTSGSSTDSNAGSSGAGATGGNNKARGAGTNSSGGAGPSNDANTSGASSSTGTGGTGTSGSGGTGNGGGGSGGANTSTGGTNNSNGTGGTSGGGG